MMFNLTTGKHKRILQRAFSSCFSSMKDELGNVPLGMQSSQEITGSILGACRGYALANNITNEASFNLIVDGVFEELFRRESVAVQTKAEKWLSTENEIFLLAYYHAKSKTINSKTIDLTWLTEYAKKHFKAGHQVMFYL
jgi:hypothetical protein